MIRLHRILPLIVLCCDLDAAPLPSASQKVRVRIGRGLSNIKVSGTDLNRILHPTKEKIRYSGRKSIGFDCSHFDTADKKRPILLASFSSPTGLLSLEENKYKGKIDIVTSKARKKCDVVNELDMEYYISSLLSKEMHASWPIEALKAQAIAARTYAIHKISSTRGLFDLENSEKHQVSGHFFDSTTMTHKAAFETKGYVLLTQEGETLTPTFFHAKCGGRTMKPDQIWMNNVEGYHAVLCPFCKDHGKKEWTSHLSKKEVVRFLNWMERKGATLRRRTFSIKNDMRIVPDTSSNNLLRLYSNDRILFIKKSQFRRYFGTMKVQSNNFRADWKNNSLVLHGTGRGHGVGMCQLGALDLAVNGWNYHQILAHYFPGHKLVKLYQ